MHQIKNSIKYRLFAGFLIVVMLVGCVGEVSYAAEIADSGLQGMVEGIMEEEMASETEEDSVLNESSQESGDVSSDSQNSDTDVPESEQSPDSQEQSGQGETGSSATEGEDSANDELSNGLPESDQEQTNQEETSSSDAAGEDSANESVTDEIPESDQGQIEQEEGSSSDAESEETTDENVSDDEPESDEEQAEQEETDSSDEELNQDETLNEDLEEEELETEESITQDDAEKFLEEIAVEEIVEQEEILMEEEDISSGVLQEGGLLNSESILGQPPVMFYGTEAALATDEIAAALISAFESFAAECNVSQFGITPTDLKQIYSDVLNNNPRLFYVSGGYQYYASQTTGYVTRVVISYDYDQSTAEAMLADYDAAVNLAVSQVDSSWTDMEKALFINDYLARNCEYDLTYSNYSAYDVFVSKTAVCQGYALAFYELAEELGLDCELVTSTSLNHAWNMVVINDEFYNVDVTWNDPTKDLTGRARHYYFMKSTGNYESIGHCEEQDWYVTGGWEADYASDTAYDTYFWDSIDTGFDYLNGSWYNFDGNSEIAAYSCDGANFVKNAKVQDITDIWYVLNSSGFYNEKFVGTGSYGGLFYYSTDDAIYTWNPKENELKTVFQLSDAQKASGYIYGLHVTPSGTIYICQKENANVEGTKSTVEVVLEETPSEDVCYVSQSGSDSNSGSASKPVATLYKALEQVKSGATIYICDSIVVNDNAGDDSPLVIDKQVTIKAKDSSMPTIDLRAGGIILGADVTFENVKIGTGSYLRPGIAANGHKLVLNNVKEDASLRPLQIYGGTFIDFSTKEDYGSSYRGSVSEITITGGEYDAVYAGSTNGTINLPVTIKVNKGNGLTLGGIYVGSTKKDPSDISTAGSIPILDESVGLAGKVDISVSGNASVTAVDGVSESNTVNLTTDGTGSYSFKVKYLDSVTVNSGTFTLASGSVFGNNESNVPDVILGGSADNKATLDLSECTSSSNKISINDFTGSANSIFVLNKNHTLILSGALAGTSIEFRLSGGMPWSSAEEPGYSGSMEYNKKYISGGTGTGTFVISNPYPTQIGMDFTSDSSVANGWTTVEESEFEMPKLLDFTISSKEVTYEDMNALGGVEIGVSATYDEEEWYPYLYWIPLTYKVTYTDKAGNTTAYKKQLSTCDDSGIYWCDYTSSTSAATSTDVLMKLEPFADEEGNTNITIQKVSKDIAAGTYVIEVTAPTDSGYVTRTFTLTVKAKAPTIYNITYNLNGGTNNAANPSTFTSDDAAITLKAPTRKGYTFAGWYSDSACTEKVTTIAGGMTGNVTLYAKWTAIQYSIKYNGNGATAGSMSNQTGLKYDTAYTLTANAFTKKGYTLKGWNTKADGTGTLYANKASVKNLTATNGQTVTLYAQWTKVKYTITYSLNGGTNNSGNPAAYYVDSAAITLKNPTRKGYTFAGWYSDSAYTKKVTSIATGSTGNRTLYAKWIAIQYSIKYNGNGATAGSMNNQTGLKYDTAYTLTANSYKKAGYAFRGWNTKVDGSGTSYKDKTNVKNMSSVSGQTVTLYAQWTKIYTITYTLNGGSNNSENPTIYCVDSATVELKNPSRIGFIFNGWYNDMTSKERVTSISEGSTGNKILYARWTANKYNICFKGNGATGGSMNSQTGLKYGTTYALSENGFTRDGFVFNGWNTLPNGSGTAFTDKANIKSLTTGNGQTVTLHAQWKKEKYTITYNLNGGKNNSENPKEFYVTSKTITLRNPSRTGFTFSGWYNDMTSKERVASIPEGSTGNRTLYARWTANKYNICFKGNGATEGNMSNQTGLKYGTTYALPENGFTRDGFVFNGWNTLPNGSGTAYTDKASIRSLTAVNGQMITLYAQWKKVKYTITYNLNGGTNNSANPKEYYVISDTITLKVPSRKGFTFIGWYSDASGKERVTSIPKGSIGNRILYARWTVNKYNICFRGNGATGGSMSNQAGLKYGTAYALTENGFTRNGFIFNGWNTKPNGSGIAYKNKASIKNLTAVNGQTITLFAQWRAPYINATSRTINAGSTYTLKLVGTTIQSATSSDTTVAVVANTGVVTAKKAGTATITLKGANGKTYKCAVTVK